MFFDRNGNFSPLKRVFLTLFATLFFFCFGGCKKEFDYTPYVSELRSNIFLAEVNGLSLRIYAVKKEHPYAADGIPREGNSRLEAYLLPPSEDKSCEFYFTVNGREYGGDMSFDNVKTEYYYACSLDVSSLQEFPCKLKYGNETYEFTAHSVLEKEVLSPQSALKKLQECEGELFTSLTDKYGFAGEIHLRLIYEESPYYYIGIIDRKGNVHAFLLSAKTGKVLAKRRT